MKCREIMFREKAQDSIQQNLNHLLNKATVKIYHHLINLNEILKKKI